VAQAARPTIYVVHVVNVDKLTSTSTIHVVGACDNQDRPGTASPQGLATWSDYLLTLKEARAFAAASGTQHVKMCPICESQEPGRRRPT
jgi:hypothetical protein